jgi:hypothetical protein
MSRRFALFVSMAALAASTAACGHDSTIAQAIRNRSVKGRYVYAGSGRTVTIPWRFNAALDLDGRGKYALDVDVAVRGEGDRNTSHGTYTVDNDRLTLASGRSKESHELLIRGVRWWPRPTSAVR